MIGIIWDLYQSHRIGQLDKRINDVQGSSGKDRVARDTAFGLEEKVDRLFRGVLRFALNYGRARIRAGEAGLLPRTKLDNAGEAPLRT